MSEATAKETAERCCEAALAALERGDADKAQRLAEKAMRLAPSDEVRREMKGGRRKKNRNSDRSRTTASSSSSFFFLLRPRTFFFPPRLLSPSNHNAHPNLK
jgi:hypothetical protein